MEFTVSGSLPRAGRLGRGQPTSAARPSIGKQSTHASTMAASPTQRHTIHYTGHVQGVGFRYTTHSIARNHEVTGYVRNLPDGRVELVAEGDRQDTDAFLEAIRD